MGQETCVWRVWGLSSCSLPPWHRFSAIGSSPLDLSLAPSSSSLFLCHHCCCPLPAVGGLCSTFTLLPVECCWRSVRRGQDGSCALLCLGSGPRRSHRWPVPWLYLEGDSVGVSCPPPIQVPIAFCWHRGCSVWGLPSTIRMLDCGKGRLSSHFLGPVVSFCTGNHTNYIAGPVSMISRLPLYIIKFIDWTLLNMNSEDV